ncbi:hypothetical protein J7K91_01830 [bacterium]|nr:hypothetical protein [bacterium]
MAEQYPEHNLLPEEEQTAISDEVGPTSSEGGRNVSEGDVLAFIEEATGRKYPDIETAKKALKETYSYVGKAGQYEKMVKAIADKLGLGDEKGVQEWLEELENPEEDLEETEEISVEDELKAKVEELEFLTKHPDLKEYLPVLKKIAKADGISLEEAKETEFFKDYLQAKTSLKESQTQASPILEGSQRVGFHSDKLKSLVEEYKKNPNLDLATKIIEESGLLE